MNLVTLVTGILIPFIIFGAIKLGRKLPKIKVPKVALKNEELKLLITQIEDLKITVSDIKVDLQNLHTVVNDSQKTNELLFPENFDKDKSDGKTVFVKNGEEKAYETIDWRSR